MPRRGRRGDGRGGGEGRDAGEAAAPDPAGTSRAGAGPRRGWRDGPRRLAPTAARGSEGHQARAGSRRPAGGVASPSGARSGLLLRVRIQRPGRSRPRLWRVVQPRAKPRLSGARMAHEVSRARLRAAERQRAGGRRIRPAPSRPRDRAPPSRVPTPQMTVGTEALARAPAPPPEAEVEVRWWARWAPGRTRRVCP